MAVTTVTMQLAAYSELRLPLTGTVAYMNGDAPHLFLRDGSDAKRLTPGQCIPIDGSFAKLINPFPRPVEVLIARGLPISMGPEPFNLTTQQEVIVTSNANVGNPGVAGFRFGTGAWIKRGRALLTIYDDMTDGLSQFVFIRGIGQNFLSTKPVGCMDGGVFFGGFDGERDEGISPFGGSYTDAQFTAWMAAAASSSQLTVTVRQKYPGLQRLMIQPDQAVLYRRPDGAVSAAYLRIQHLGADLTEFD